MRTTRKRRWLEDERPHAAGSGAMAEINLTPLIDVLLVLLIIFMVAVPITQHSLEAAIPEKSTKPTTPPPSVPVLEVRADLFQLDHEMYSSIDELEKGLGSKLSTRRDKAVILKAGATIDYGRVIAAMDAARGAGATRVGILPAEESGTR